MKFLHIRTSRRAARIIREFRLSQLVFVVSVLFGCVRRWCKEGRTDTRSGQPRSPAPNWAEVIGHGRWKEGFQVHGVGYVGLQALVRERD